jgi:hypothetical protein
MEPRRPPLVPILSHMNPAYTLPSYFLNIFFMLFHHLGRDFPGGLFKVIPPELYSISVLSSTCCMLHPSNSYLFDHRNNNRLGVQIKKLLIMQFSSVCCYFIPLWSKYSSHFEVCVVNMRDQASHP